MRRLTAPFAILLIGLMAIAGYVHAADVAKLISIDQKIGSGAQAREDSDVQIQYTGWLYDPAAKDHHGAKFDSSYDSGQPLSFTLGAEQVIAGMDHGVRGMKVGGKRTLIIPSSQGYGRRGEGDDIPPNSALVFDIELISVR